MADVSPKDSHNEPDRDRVLRRLIVDAALEVLDRDGLSLRAEAITYAKVFAYIAEQHDVRITRSSVHGRLWNSQEEFRTEVLVAAANHTTPYGHAEAMHDGATSILAAIDAQDLDHRARVQAFSRISAGALLSTYLESEGFRRFQAIKAMARLGEDESARSTLQSMVRKQADGDRDERLGRFRWVFRALGLRARASLGIGDDEAIDVFTTLLQVLITGTHLDHHGGFTRMVAGVDTDLDADDEWPWTGFSLGYLAFLDFLFEEDPDAGIEQPSPPARAVGRRSPPGETKTSVLPSTGPRRSRDELRRLVVSAGVEVFMRDGLGLKAESLSYTTVFDHIKKTRGLAVHRSTVHPHIWSSQDEFQNDVLAEAARYDTGESLTTMQQAMAAQTVSRTADGSVSVRQLILDNARAMTTADMAMATTSSSYRRWQSIKAATLWPLSGDKADVIREAVNQRYCEMLDSVVGVYRSVLPLVGLQVKPELGVADDDAYHLFATVCATLSTGGEYNTSAGARLATRTVGLPRADDPQQRDDWPIPSIGALAILDFLFAPSAPAAGS